MATRVIVNDLAAGTRPAADRITSLVHLAVPVFAVLIGSFWVDVIRARLTAQMTLGITARARRLVARRLISQSLARANARRSGDMASIVVNDCASLGALAEKALVVPAVEAGRVAATVGAMFWLNWPLALTAVVVLPSMAIASTLLGQRLRPQYAAIQSEQGSLHARLVEILQGLRVIRIFGAERRTELGHTLQAHVITRLSQFVVHRNSIVENSWTLLITAGFFTVICAGGVMVIHHRATWGDLTAILLFISLLIEPLFRLVSALNQIQPSLAAAERIAVAFHSPEDETPSQSARRVLPGTIETLSFENVTFGYEGGPKALDSIQLHVCAPATVAFIGPSGSGKSTLLSLVARLYDPDSGKICVNGIDIRELDLVAYRKSLSLVDQDVFLFHGTIRENILMGNPSASVEQLEQVVLSARVAEFLPSLPAGLDTFVGERGQTLSGGQRQRIAIARALLARPSILMLDEATSNLDAENESLIQQALIRERVARLVLVVAHRLQTAAAADLIAVIEGGRIVEFGRPAELRAQKGLFSAMWELQQSASDNFYR